jgi:hypothetical protein
LDVKISQEKGIEKLDVKVAQEKGIEKLVFM